MTKIITEITVLDTDQDVYELVNMPEISITVSRSMDELTHRVEKEFVRGKRFVSHNGQDVVIGWCKELADLIGLPMDVYENMQREIDFINTDNQNLNELIRTREGELLLQEKTIESLKDQTVWYHLKEMFKARRMFMAAK